AHGLRGVAPFAYGLANLKSVVIAPLDGSTRKTVPLLPDPPPGRGAVEIRAGKRQTGWSGEGGIEGRHRRDLTARRIDAIDGAVVAGAVGLRRPVEQSAVGNDAGPRVSAASRVERCHGLQLAARRVHP